MTYFLERLAHSLKALPNIAPVVVDIDLSRYGEYSTVQALVRLRNQILQRFDELYAFSDLRAAFIAFDIIALVAWRRRARGEPIEPQLYNPTVSKRLLGLAKLGKGAILGNLIEGAAEALGLGALAEAAAQEATDKAAEKAIKSILKRLEPGVDDHLLAELQKTQGKASDMEAFLPKLFADALDAAAMVDKSGASKREWAGKKVEFTLIIDSADELQGAGLLGETVRVRDRLGVLLGHLSRSDFASVVIGGREEPGFKQFPQWRNSLDGINVDQVRLGAIPRLDAMASLKAHGLDEDQIGRILVSVSPEREPLHAVAYCEAFRGKASLPNAVLADRARTLVWAAADNGCFHRDDLERCGGQLLPNLADVERSEAIDAAWTHNYWSNEADNGRLPAWYVMVTRDLVRGKPGGW